MDFDDMTVALNVAILLDQDAWAKRDWPALTRQCGVNSQQLQEHATRLGLDKPAA